MYYKAIEFDLIEYPIKNLTEDDMRLKARQEMLQRQRIEEREERNRKIAELAGKNQVV